MAKNLTELTERTATANTDLMHINSGGTDYKETKENFLNGTLKMSFATDTLLTTQADALSNGTWFGNCSSYGHQSEVGIPINSAIIVVVRKFSSQFCEIEISPVGDSDTTYKIAKNNGSWGSTWTLVPKRSEIDSIFNRIVIFNFNLASGGTAKHSLASHVPYGNESGVVFLQPRGFTVNNISKIFMFRFNQAKTACYFTDVTPGVTSSLSARLDSEGNFYNTSTDYSVTYDCALFLLYY